MKKTTNEISKNRARETASDLLALADAAWMSEIAAVFGNENVDAVAAAPKGQGESGSRLRELFDAHIDARTVWSNSHEGKPELG